MIENIDRRGRIARAVSGILCILIGAMLLAFHWPQSDALRWTISAAAIASGAFQIFEARKGWCIARACGIKTPV